MTTYNLINTIPFGKTTLKSGSVINTLSEDVAQVVSAGGILVPTGLSTTLDALALTVADMWRSGKDQILCDTAMLGGYLTYVSTYVVAHDHVDSTTSTEGSKTTSVAVDSNTTALTVVATPIDQLFVGSACLPAAGTPVHADDAGGGALNLIAGFTNPVPRRVLNIARTAAGPANVTYTCYYNAPGSLSTTTSVIVPSGGNASTLVAGEWTRVTTTVDPVSVTSFTTGVGFSVGQQIQTASTPVLSCNGVAETIISSELPSGTITPTTAPDGTRQFCVQFKTSNGHGVTDGGHVHSVTDPGHTHTHASHTHTLS